MGATVTVCRRARAPDLPVPEAPPPARLFIFSDMDFNAALGRDASELHTDLEEARRRFAKAGPSCGRRS